MVSVGAKSDTADLEQELRRVVGGEVRFDAMSRVLYSTDASIYQIEPIGVVLPRDADDVAAVIETAARRRVPVLPRGGGTSLAGQAVGHAIIIDFSKYMRGLLETNAAEGWVSVQPGIILDELNLQVAPTGLHFAPDPSTSNRGNVGGALGNNSCGAHSIIWGKTIDHVLELQVVLSNGDRATFGPADESGLETKARGDNLESEIYRKLLAIGEANRDEVVARYPKIQRRVSGYNLDELLGEGGFDMARFVVGSEGTLAAITEAKLRLVPQPRSKALCVVQFDELIESMEATVAVLDLDPAAVELVDRMILRGARSSLEYSRMMDFVEGDPAAILLIEVAGESDEEVTAKLDRVEKRLAKKGLGYAIRRVVRPEEQAKVWAVRKAGLGLMMNAPGASKPLPFVEDTAVPTDALPEYVRRFDELVRSHGTTAGFYGHASVGCLHIRPLIDLKLQDGVDRMASIASDVSDLVLEYGGAMSGEHGDGLVRSVWIEKMFGSKIYEAFREVKQAFDPAGTMNPGKIVDSPPMTENLRTGPGQSSLDIDTGLAFAAEGGFTAALEMCNGQGACRKVTSGTMCPSYMVTRDEEHTTRARANALRAAMTGALPVDSLTSRRLYDVLDLCLECKGCRGECPSNVDMAKLKYEFLNRYHETNGFPVRNRLFGNLSALNRMGSFFAPLSNWALRSRTFKEMLEEYAGIDRRRELPSFASQTFRQWFRSRGGSPLAAETKGQVVLFADTFTDYNHPELGKAATHVLEKLGYQVVVPDTKCCGRPMLSAGMMEKARRNAQANVETVRPYVEAGAKVVGLEPSCILSFRDEYLDLLGGDSAAAAVSKSTMLIEEFVLHARREGDEQSTFAARPGKVLMHGHCHQKATVGTKPAMEVLRSIPGCDPEEIPSGCCGMAGSFGFEKEHYEVSLQIAEQTLLPAIRSQPGDFAVVSEGVSCRQQIEHATGKRPKHLVQILDEAL